MKKSGRKNFVQKSLLIWLLVLSLSWVPVQADVSPGDVEEASQGEFVREDGKWFYEYPDGDRARDTLLDIEGDIYYFSPEGVRLFGWQEIEGKTYYFGKKSEGFMYAKCWLTLGKDRYYFTKDGEMATGLVTISKKKYYFGEDGKRLCGWQEIDGNTYYFGTENQGWMVRGSFLPLNGRLYYLNQDGTRARGWTEISGNRYYFTPKGAVTGTRTIDGVKYFFDEKGKLLYTGADISVSADCAILVDSTTGEILYGKNENQRHANASTTKILTAIMALEKCKLKEEVTASANAVAQEPTKLYLHEGETFTMEQLLHSLLIPSHNDSAVAIAEHVGGTVSRFAVLMNRKARELGCTDTHFVTPNGLDRDLNHYTTARDLAIITEYAMKNRTFRSIVKKTSYSFTSLSGYSYSFSTTNRFLGNMEGVVGVKTGFTNKAGQCFVGAIKCPNGHTCISVILGETSGEQRWADSEKLLQYAYNQ